MFHSSPPDAWRAGLLYSCAGQIDVQTQTVIHWPTELQKTKELQTNHWWHLSSLLASLSFAETQKHTYLEMLRHRHHCPDLMYWNVHFTSTERTQDNISLKRQISLQIKIQSSMSGHIQRMTDHKGTELQDTQANTDQPTILLFIIIQRAKWLTNWFMCFNSTMLLPENTTENHYIANGKTRATPIFMCNHKLCTKTINGKFCCCLPLTLLCPLEPW